MPALEKLIHNYAVLIPTLIIVCVTALVAAQFLWNLLEDFLVNKLGIETKWGRTKRQEHELLVNTVQKLNELSEKHGADMKRSDERDDELKRLLTDFIKESSVRNERVRQDLENAVKQINESVTKINDDNVEHWETSKSIRSEMNERIYKVIESNKERDNLIKAIAEGNKELLGDKIDQKFEKYVRLGGIPMNEVDEFESLCQAYFGLNGNHNRKSKYHHVKNNMEVIPVKTELVIHE